MSAEENKTILRRFVEEVWNQRKFEVLDEICAPNLVLHDPTMPGLSQGPEGIKQYISPFFAAFPDVQVEIDDVFAEADRVALRCTIRGTHKGELMGIPPTGKQVTFTGQAIYRLANGKIAEDWIAADVFGLLQQLRAIPK